MYSQTRIKKVINELKDTKLTAGLNTEQVDWVKDKVDLIENWKDTAVTKLTQLDSQIAALQTAGQNLAGRVSTLETKMAAGEAKIADHETRIKALEDV